MDITEINAKQKYLFYKKTLYFLLKHKKDLEEDRQYVELIQELRGKIESKAIGEKL